MNGFEIKPADFINNVLHSDKLDEIKGIIKPIKFDKKRDKYCGEKSCCTCLFCKKDDVNGILIPFCHHLKSQKYGKVVTSSENCVNYVGKDY